ncbi:MAG: hypothetical protein JW982_16405 [Spirochaetes bacterium]|nr:hypothetical protein [Spirochaetota bacterium]
MPGENKNETNYFSTDFWKKYFRSGKAAPYPLVFIHGIANEESAWSKTAGLISDSTFFKMRFMDDKSVYHDFYGTPPEHWVWTVSYYTPRPVKESLTGSISLYSKRLEEMLKIIKKITNSSKVILIAHSMGGLVARNFMSLNMENWNMVYKILTVGTPNTGVPLSLNIVGQLKELKQNSRFIQNLESRWEKYYCKTTDKKWGVVGGVSKRTYKINFKENLTDSGGPGFVKLDSAIPFGEAEESTGQNFNKLFYDTKNFGFRTAVPHNHMKLLFCEGTFAGIEWASAEFNF